MVKKLTVFFMFCVLVMPIMYAGHAYADTTTLPAMNKIATFQIGSNDVSVDGAVYQMDVAPFVENSRTYVPVRFLGELLGATNIAWSNGEVDFTFPGKSISLKLNQPWLNNKGQYTLMDVVPVMKDPPGRMFLPARYVTEAVGMKVNWDEGNQKVLITK